MSPSLQTRRLTDLLAGFADGVPSLDVADIVLDSRAATPGALFLACRGHHQHGIAHVAQAVAKGASVVAWEPTQGVAPPVVSVPAFAVPELGARAGEIAARFWRRPSAQLHVAGITGTDGKTSTAHLLAQASDLLGTPCAYFGTLGSGRLGALDATINTTPDPVTLQRRLAGMVADGARACAMEVSSHALAQNRIAGMQFAAAVLTNIGRDHLDYHGDVEHYAAAKRRLFDRPDSATLVFNRDDARGARWARELADAHEIIVYGIGGDVPDGPHVVGRALQTHARGLSLEVAAWRGAGRIDSPLLGRFNAYNLLAAAAVLIESGVAVADACAALSRARTVPGRAEAFHGPRAAPLVVVDYAHTPQALTQILAALRAHARGRLICVFGCGGDRDRGKRPLMGAAAAHGADVVIVTDDNPRTEDPRAIVAEVRAGIPVDAAVQVIHDRTQAIGSAIDAAAADDIVLVAGKGHEDYQIVGDEHRPFSDRALVAERVGAEVAS